MKKYVSLKNFVGPIEHGYADPASVLVEVAHRDGAPMVGAFFERGTPALLEFVLACRDRGLLPAIAFPLHDGDYQLCAYPMTVRAWRVLQGIFRAGKGVGIREIAPYQEDFLVTTGGNSGRLVGLLIGNASHKVIADYIDRLKGTFKWLYVELNKNNLPFEYCEDALLVQLQEIAAQRGLPFFLASDGRYRDDLGRSLDLLLMARSRPGGLFAAPHPANYYELGEFFYDDTSSAVARVGEVALSEGLADAYERLRGLGEWLCERWIATMQEAHRQALLPAWVAELHRRNARMIVPLAEYFVPGAKRWGIFGQVLTCLCAAGMELRYGLTLLPKRSLFDAELGKDLRRFLPANATRALHTAQGPEVRERLREELEVIEERGESARILTTLEIALRCARSGIRTNVRGSAAGSAVLYALGISSVEPIALGLRFERFLSKARQRPPDIDFEVEAEQRDALVNELCAQRGFHKLSVAVRWGMDSYREVVQKALGGFDEQRTVSRAVGRAVKPFAEALRDALRGYASSPSAAVCVATEERDVMPFMEGGILGMTHDQAESLGLRKVDVLSSRWLSLLAELRREAPGEVNVADGLSLIERGFVYGLFQLDASPAARKVVERMKPKDFRAVMDCLALNRPGANHQLLVYTGLAEPIFPRAWLPETNGALIYQEQINEIGVKYLGMSPLEGEAARAGLCKGNFDDPAVVEFFRRLADHVDVEQARAVLARDGGYLFNRAHAASYAQLVVECAALKAGYPALYMVRFWAQRREEADVGRGMQEYLKMGGRFCIPERWEVEASVVHPVCCVRLGVRNMAAMLPGVAVADLVRAMSGEVRSREERAFYEFLRGDRQAWLALLSKQRVQWGIDAIMSAEVENGNHLAYRG